jgi:hypothetical protein
MSMFAVIAGIAAINNPLKNHVPMACTYVRRHPRIPKALADQANVRRVNRGRIGDILVLPDGTVEKVIANVKHGNKRYVASVPCGKLKSKEV